MGSPVDVPNPSSLLGRDRIHRVVDLSDPSEPHVHLFVGAAVPSPAMEVLQELLRTPMRTPTRKEHRTLSETWGQTWSFRMGLPQWNPWALWPTKAKVEPPTEPPSMPPTDPRLQSWYEHAQKHRTFLNSFPERAKWSYHAVPWSLFPDDTLGVIQKKILLSVSTRPYAMLPEWQILWQRGRDGVPRALGVFLEEPTAHDTHVVPHSHPGPHPWKLLEQLAEAPVEQLLLGKNAHSPVLRVLHGVLQRTLQVQHLTDILWDSASLGPPSTDLYLVGLPDFIDRIVRHFGPHRLYPSLQDVLRNGLLHLYVSVSSSRVQKLLERFATAPTAEASAAFFRMCGAYSRSQLGPSTLIAHQNQQLEQLVSTPRVGNGRPAVFIFGMVYTSVNSHPYETKGAVPVDTLFEVLEPDLPLYLMRWYGDSVGRVIPPESRRTKIHIDPEFFNTTVFDEDIMKRIRKDDFDNKKPNSLSLRLVFHDIEMARVTLTIDSSGASHFTVGWRKSEPTLRDLELVFDRTADYVVKKIHPHVEGGRIPVRLPFPPDKRFLYGTASNVNLISMQVSFRLPEGESLPPLETLYARLQCYPAVFQPKPLEIYVRERMLEDPYVRNLVPVLEASRVEFRPSALQAFASQGWSRAEWSAGSVPESSRADCLHHLELFLSRLEGREYPVFFRRHNHSQTLYDITVFVREQVRQAGFTLLDPRISAFRQHLQRQVLEQFHLSPEEAWEAVRQALLSPEDRSKGPRRITLQFAPAMNKVTIRGIRDLKRGSSIAFLLQNIEDLVLRLAHPDVPCISQAVPAVASSASASETTPVKTVGDMDAQFFDLFDEMDSALEDVDATPEGDGDEDTGDQVPLVPIQATEAVRGALSDASALDATALGVEAAASNTTTAEGFKLKRLRLRDPELFQNASFEDKKKGSPFVRRCTRERQPVSLSPEEYEQYRNMEEKPFTLPAAAPDGMFFRGNYYICPAYWCEGQGAVFEKDLLEVKRNAKGRVVSATCPNGRAAFLGDSAYRYIGFYSHHTVLGNGDMVPLPCCARVDWKNKTDTFLRWMQQGKAKDLQDLASAGDPENESAEAKLTEGDLHGFLTTTRKQEYKMAFGRHLANNRIGFLPDAVRAFFTEDEVHRIGTSDGSLVAAFLKLYNLCAHADGRPLLADEDAFRGHLVEHLQDDVLVTSLLGGEVRMTYEWSPGHNFVQSLALALRQDPISDKLLWDLAARPLPWFFPEGLQLFLFATSKEAESGYELRCPLHISLVHGYRGRSPSAFLFEEKPGQYYVLLRTLPERSKDPFPQRWDVRFPPSRKACMEALRLWSQCGAVVDSARASMGLPVAEVEALARRRGWDVVAQWVHAYHRVKGLVLSNQVIVPCPAVEGVIWSPERVIPVRRTVVPPPASTVYETLRSLGGGFVPIAWVAPPGKRVAIGLRLADGQVAPIQPTAPSQVPGKLPFFAEPYTDLDDALAHAEQGLRGEGSDPDERVRFMTAHRRALSLYAQFLRELSGFLKRDLKETPDWGSEAKGLWKKRYWFYIRDILQATKRPVEERQRALYTLFAEGIPSQQVKPLFQVLTGPDAPPTGSSPIGGETLGDASLCMVRPTDVQGPRSCLVHPDCTVHRGKCKLFVPRELQQQFLRWVVDDLLRNAIYRSQVFDRPGSSDIVSTRGVLFQKNWIQFDDTDVLFIFHLLSKPEDVHPLSQNLDMGRRTTGNERQILQFFERRNMEKMKVKGDFGSLSRSLPATLQTLLPGFVSRQVNSILQNLWYLVYTLQVPGIATENQFRRHLMQRLQERKGWSEYIAKQQRRSLTFRGIRSLTMLRELFLSDGYTGTLVDLELTSTVFPLVHLVLRATTRATTLVHVSRPPTEVARSSWRYALWLQEANGSLLLLVHVGRRRGSVNETVFQPLFTAAQLPRALVRTFADQADVLKRRRRSSTSP